MAYGQARPFAVQLYKDHPSQITPRAGRPTPHGADCRGQLVSSRSPAGDVPRGGNARATAAPARPPRPSATSASGGKACCKRVSGVGWRSARSRATHTAERPSRPPAKARAIASSSRRSVSCSPLARTARLAAPPPWAAAAGSISRANGGQCAVVQTNSTSAVTPCMARKRARNHCCLRTSARRECAAIKTRLTRPSKYIQFSGSRTTFRYSGRPLERR
mmetsp:Transcript_48671/g.155510  ORF Transcript_48671/g.155510 Transcript_48671/m.155510 type:complete len:219 (+) Transcript_48671:457-1113(+)